jgi:hypothetical protein
VARIGAVTRRPVRLLGLALIVLLTASACGTEFRAPAAVVHGVDIADGELRAIIPEFRFLTAINQEPCGRSRPGEKATSACARFVLGQLIVEQLVAPYSLAHHLRVRPRQVLSSIVPLEQRFGGHSELVKQLGRHGLTFADLRDLATRLLVVQRAARAVANRTVTTAELRSVYRQDRIEFTLIHAAHILVSSPSLAARIAREATPQNFAALARRYSTDTGSNFRGGDLGTTRASALDRTFALAALSLQPGQISGPVHTQFGWHVIYLISAQTIPFSSARRQLVALLADRVFTRWLRHRAASGIAVNPKYGTFDPVHGQVIGVRCTAATPSVSCRP